MGVSIWEGNKAQGLVDVGHLMVEGIARQNLLLSQMIQAGEATPAAELAEIHRIVQSGEAPNVFSIGEQLMLNYNDGTTAYVLPWDIVHFGNVQLQDGGLGSHKVEDNVVHPAVSMLFLPSKMGSQSVQPPKALVVTLGGNDGFTAQNTGYPTGKLVGTANMSAEHTYHIVTRTVYADNGRV